MSRRVYVVVRRLTEVGRRVHVVVKRWIDRTAECMWLSEGGLRWVE